MIGVALAFLKRLQPMTLILGGLLLFMVILAGAQALTIARLEEKLADKTMEQRAMVAESAVCEAKIVELLGAVSDQNAEVKRLSRYSDFIREEATSVSIELAQARAEHEQEISELARSQGSSCADGISLINRELKLK